MKSTKLILPKHVHSILPFSCGNFHVIVIAVLCFVANNVTAQVKVKIDEVRIYNTAIKASEVSALSSAKTQTVQASFTTPDTVCVNSPVNIKNTSAGASTYYWNFCVADINTPPTSTNLGNIGSNFSTPVFVDYAYYNGNYYGFLINYNPGALVRLDFGNSLLNTPTSVVLGNFGGVIPVADGAEGIQIVNNEGHWYAIIVGGYPPIGSAPRILKLDFGASLTNLTPLATNWGNIGNMLQPIDLHVFKEGDNWYGFTVNAENNTITRFSFTSSFNNTPTAVNLGNIGNLSYPTGIYAINDNGFWKVFIVNAGDRTRVNGPCSLSRLDFGTSLLNTPTGVNLGNPGNMLQHPRDLTILKFCDQIIGFAVNGNPNYNNIVKLNFNNNLSGTPTITSMGNIGNLNFPHSISKLFRVNNDVYGLITNAANNTISRLKFSGCNNSSISSSTLQNPPDIIYNTPGTYNINLTIDDGLATQNAFCKQIVVMPALVHSPVKTINLCVGDSVKVGAKEAGNHSWNTGVNTDSIIIKTTGIFWVETYRGGCLNRDTFNVTVNPNPLISLVNDTVACKGSTIILPLQSGGSYSYVWSPSTGLSSSTVSNPVATITNTVNYIVTATTSFNCSTKDTIKVTGLDKPVVNLGNDTTLCKGQVVTLDAKNAGASYLWSDGTTSQFNKISSPGIYSVLVSNGSCGSKDTIVVNIKDPLNFSITPTSFSLCKNDSVKITASGGTKYEWFNQGNSINKTDSIIIVHPVTTSTYNVIVVDSFCNYSDTLQSTISIKALPAITISKSNDITCTSPQSQLSASGGVEYKWTPATNISNQNIPNPVVNPIINTYYKAKVKGSNGCTAEDSVLVNVSLVSNGNFYVPSAFTPNGDGKNDCFGVKYWGPVNTFELSIYNRFGGRIFYSTNIQDCWDGSYKKEKQESGTYVYTIKVSGSCGSDFKKGTLVLIR